MRDVCLIALSIAALCATSAPARACSVQDIHVKEGWSWRIDSIGDLLVIGEIINNCSEPTGVQIQITARNSTGALLDVEECWPASTRNIPPKSAYAFEACGTHSGLSEIDTVNISVIEVRNWNNRN